MFKRLWCLVTLCVAINIMVFSNGHNNLHKLWVKSYKLQTSIGFLTNNVFMCTQMCEYFGLCEHN